MGISERKERERMEMREKILSAATAMFLQEGYEKTSIRNVAEKIEYSPATIYLYFKDKDELFYAIHDLGFQKLLKQMERVRKVQDPLERLRELGLTYIDFAITNPEYYDLMFILRAPMNAIREKKEEHACWTNGENTFSFLMQTVEDCVKSGKIRSNDVLLTSMSTWSLVHGMVSLYIRDRFLIMELTDTQLRKMMIDSLDHTLRILQS